MASNCCLLIRPLGHSFRKVWYLWHRNGASNSHTSHISLTLNVLPMFSSAAITVDRFLRIYQFQSTQTITYLLITEYSGHRMSLQSVLAVPCRELLLIVLGVELQILQQVLRQSSASTVAHLPLSLSLLSRLQFTPLLLSNIFSPRQIYLLVLQLFCTSSLY